MRNVLQSLPGYLTPALLFPHSKCCRVAFLQTPLVYVQRLGQGVCRIIHFRETRIAVNICFPEALVCARPLAALGQVRLRQHWLQIRIVVHVERETLHRLNMVQLYSVESHLCVMWVLCVVLLHFDLNMLDRRVKRSCP